MSLRYIDENGNETSIAGVGKDGKDGRIVDDRLFTKLIPDGTEIVANKNLNTTEFLKVGRYFCPASSTAGTLSNAPDGNAFVMNVYSPISDTIDNEDTGTPYVYRIQDVLTYNGLRYTRSCETGSAGTWTYGAWKKVSYDATPDILFTNTSGATSGTLSASVRNYTYIEVFYTWTRGTIATGVKDSVKVFNNKADFNSYLAENVVYSDTDAKGGTYGTTVKLVFSTTTFRSSNAHQYEGAAINSNNDFKVTRVLGYK